MQDVVIFTMSKFNIFCENIKRLTLALCTSHSIMCNICRKSGLDAVRLVCLLCSREEIFDTYDLCSNCVDETASWDDKDGKPNEHSPYHPLLQAMFPIPYRYAISMRKDAQDVVEEVRALGRDEVQSALACVYCNDKLIEPYWCCMDCGGESVQTRGSKGIIISCFTERTYVCFQCNRKMWATCPWLSSFSPESQPSSQTRKHRWSHMLVLVPKTRNAQPSLSVADRLSHMENLFSSFDQRQGDTLHSLTARMDRLEGLICQILTRLGQGSGSEGQ